MFDQFTTRNSAVSLSVVIHGSMVSFYSGWVWISCQYLFKTENQLFNTLPADKGYASVLYSVHPVYYFQATCQQEVNKNSQNLSAKISFSIFCRIIILFSKLREGNPGSSPRRLRNLGTIDGLDRRGIILYLEYQSVCPFVQIGFSRPLSLQRVCPPPLEPNGGGGSNTRSRMWGSRGSQFGRLERKPGTLYTL